MILFLSKFTKKSDDFDFQIVRFFFFRALHHIEFIFLRAISIINFAFFQINTGAKELQPISPGGIDKTH